MKSFGSIVLCILITALSSCTEESSVTPTPVSDDAPFGIPDFTQPEYGWIDTNAKHCKDFYSRLYWWSPKFYYQVADASPDGNKLLLLLADRLGVYDVSNKSLTTLASGQYLGAQWSHSGKYVSASDKNGGLDRFVTIFHMFSQERMYPVSLPANTADVDITYRFMPGDSSFLIGAAYLLNNAIQHDLFSVNITPPFTQKRLIVPGYSPDFKNTNYYSIDAIGYNEYTGTHSEVRLIIGSLTDSTIKKTYKLDKINSLSKPDSRMSSDGNWLAVNVGASMSNTKYADRTSIGGLAIIDLREGSSTQYQVYRFFPDYMKGGCNCANLDYSPGMAWSADGKYLYHQQIRISDSTTQLVRREIRTGKTEEISNFLTPP